MQLSIRPLLCWLMIGTDAGANLHLSLTAQIAQTAKTE
jgi:hypothetical protein